MAYKDESKKKEYLKKYYTLNKEKMFESHKLWRERNPEKDREYNKAYRERNVKKIKEKNKKYYIENKERIDQRNKEYDLNHSEEKVFRSKKRFIEKRAEILEYRKERIKHFPKLKVSAYISSRIRNTIKKGKDGYHWEDLVGYTREDIMEHLEKQFDENMSWNNYGSYWHIDHIIPVSYFNYTSYEDKEFKECWALSNLQPLEAKENLIKSNKLLWQK
jgi:hypothetical protein